MTKLIRVYDATTGTPFGLKVVENTDGSYTLDTNASIGDITVGAVGQGASGSSPWPVSIPSSELHLGQTGGTGYIVTGSYAGSSGSSAMSANYAIMPVSGSMLELPNAVRVSGGSAYITDISVETSGSGFTPTLRVHFFNAQPATLPTNAAGWVEKIADWTKRVGYYTMPAMTSGAGASTDTSRAISVDASATTQPRILFQAANGSTSLFVGIETTTAFNTAANQAWYFKIRMDQN